MQNKLFQRNLRLTVPEHYHSRRSIYLRPVRKAWGWEKHVMLVMVLLMLVGA